MKVRQRVLELELEDKRLKKRNCPLRSAYLPTSLDYMHKVTKKIFQQLNLLSDHDCKIAFNTLHDIYHHNQK